MEKRIVKISTPNTAPRTKKRRGLLLVQLFIVVGFLAIVGVSFGVNVLPKKYAGAPEKLGNMKIGSIIEGPAAMAQVNQLHGTDIELVSVFIVEYSHDFNPYHKNDEQVTVWVGKTKSDELALELTERMFEGIRDGGSSGFRNPQKLSVDGYEVFQIDGPGGTHFFYPAADPPRVVWLTIQSKDASTLLQEALKNF